MAAPQSGTSACARGQLLSSMATAPWQLARWAGPGAPRPRRLEPARRPSSGSSAAAWGGNCFCGEGERPEGASEARWGRPGPFQKTVSGRAWTAGRETRGCEGFCNDKPSSLKLTPLLFPQPSSVLGLIQGPAVADRGRRGPVFTLHLRTLQSFSVPLPWPSFFPLGPPWTRNRKVLRKVWSGVQGAEE